MRCRRCGSTEVVLFKDRHRCSVCDSTEIKGVGTQNQKSGHRKLNPKFLVVSLVGKIFASLLTAGFYHTSNWFGEIQWEALCFLWLQQGWSSYRSNSSSKGKKTYFMKQLLLKTIAAVVLVGVVSRSRLLRQK